MEFMSQEHIDAMNARLAADADIRKLCADLPRDFTMAYKLTDGPEGNVWWTTTFSREHGMSYGLHKPEVADVFLQADWADTIRSSKAAHDGKQVEQDVTVEGDGEFLPTLLPILAWGRKVAEIETTFPEVD